MTETPLPHTPTPWRQIGGFWIAAKSGKMSARIRGFAPDDTRPAIVISSVCTTPEEIARFKVNVQFIIKAVNTLEKLYTMRERLRGHYERIQSIVLGATIDA